MWALCWLQGSADSNYSQPSSDLSLDEEKETLRREKERQALNQLEKARVSWGNELEVRLGYSRLIHWYMSRRDKSARVNQLTGKGRSKMGHSTVGKVRVKHADTLVTVMVG